MGAVTAWVDKDGHTHKEKPAQESTGHPCTFSGFSAALDLPDLGAAVVAPRPVQTALLITRIAEVAIGRGLAAPPPPPTGPPANLRSEEHTSELQSLMRISYAVFCLKKKQILTTHRITIKSTLPE